MQDLKGRRLVRSTEFQGDPITETRRWSFCVFLSCGQYRLPRLGHDSGAPFNQNAVLRGFEVPIRTGLS